MKILDFPNAPCAHLLARDTVLYRVQAIGGHAGEGSRPVVRMHLGRERNGRFDLAERPTAYLAVLPQTALHEAIYRKNLYELETNALDGRELLAVATTSPLNLADLRPYSAHFPVLQSVRTKETRELANDLFLNGFDGLVYSSAQQDGHLCVVLFDPPSSLFGLLWRSPLREISGSGGAWSAVASQGARIPPKG